MFPLSSRISADIAFLCPARSASIADCLNTCADKACDVSDIVFHVSASPDKTCDFTTPIGLLNILLFSRMTAIS